MPRSSSSSSKRHGRERLEDDREVVGDGRDHGEQVQHVSGATIVRQIAALERRALAREDVGELTMRLGVRAVAATGRERVLVDPEEVAAIRPRGTGQATRDRDARRLAGRGEPLGLALALRLRHLQDDRSRRPSRRPGRTRTPHRRARRARARRRPRSRGRRAARRTPRAGAAGAADRARASRRPRNRPRAPATRRARGAASRSSSGRRTPALVDELSDTPTRLVHQRALAPVRTESFAFAIPAAAMVNSRLQRF